MKVKIGGYIDWIGPYQIAEKLLFWEKDKDKIHSFGKKLAEKNGKETKLARLCEWIHSKRKRKISIKIDKFDAWNANDTLSMIALPLLLELKKIKHGSGMVDMEDVPYELQQTGFSYDSPQLNLDFEDQEKYEQESWDLIHKRWEYVLNEIIWALEQDQPDNNWEEQYWKTHPEIDFEEREEDKGKNVIPLRWKVEGECDWENRQKHKERIDNGLRLFGKYYQCLWD